MYQNYVFFFFLRRNIFLHQKLKSLPMLWSCPFIGLLKQAWRGKKKQQQQQEKKTLPRFKNKQVINVDQISEAEKEVILKLILRPSHPLFSLLHRFNSHAKIYIYWFSTHLSKLWNIAWRILCYMYGTCMFLLSI